MGKYKITAPVEGYEGKGYGLSFVKGVAETDSEFRALQLAEIGYKVEPDPMAGSRKPEVQNEPSKLPAALGSSNLKEGFPGRDAFFSAGLKTHRAIFNAKDEDLLGIPGVSSEIVQAARESLSALIAQESK